MRSDYVNSGAFRLLINSMEYENGLALRVSLETGLRIGDVLALRSCDLNGTKLFYVAKKTGKAGCKTISRRLATALLRCAGNSEWLFPSNRAKSGHRTRHAVYRDLKKVCKRLGVEGQISPHSARKSYAVEDFRENGLEHVKRELQHDSESVTLLYALSDVLSGAPSDAQGGENAILLAEIHTMVTELLQIVRKLAANLR